MHTAARSLNDVQNCLVCSNNLTEVTAFLRHSTAIFSGLRSLLNLVVGGAADAADAGTSGAFVVLEAGSGRNASGYVVMQSAGSQTFCCM